MHYLEPELLSDKDHEPTSNPALSERREGTLLKKRRRTKKEMEKDAKEFDLGNELKQAKRNEHYERSVLAQ